MWSTTTAWHFNRREWCFLQVIFTKLCTFSFTTQFLHSFSSTELQWKMTNKVPDLKTKSSDHHNEDACTRKFWGRSFSVKLFEWLRSHWISLGPRICSHPFLLCRDLSPSLTLLRQSEQGWLGHRDPAVKTSGPARLSAGKRLPGRADCREPTGVREKCCFTNKAVPDPRFLIHPEVYGAATLRKSLQKHNPPHSTKTNKQGHPNFSIRAPGRGQETGQCSLTPSSSIPRPSGADFGEEKENWYSDGLSALTETLRTCWQGCQHIWRTSTATMAPACDRPVIQVLV